MQATQNPPDPTQRSASPQRPAPHRLRRTLARAAAVVVVALLGVLLAPATAGAAPLPGVTMAVSYAGTQATSISLPVGADFEYLVNYTCATEPCVDYRISIPFPAGVVIGNPSYGSDIVGLSRTGDVNSGTTLVFTMASSIPPGTSGQFTIPASTPAFSTVDNSAFSAVATMSSTVGGAPTSTSAPVVVTARADVELRSLAEYLSGGVVDDVSRYRASTCLDLVLPSNVWGLLGTEPASTLVVTLPAGAVVLASPGGTFAAGVGGSPDTITYTVGARTSLGCGGYDITVRYPASDPANTVGASKNLGVSWDAAELGKSVATYTHSVSHVLTAPATQPSVPQLFSAGLNTPRAYGSAPVKKAAVDDTVTMGTAMNNTGTTSWSSAVVEYPIPGSVRLNSIGAANNGASPGVLEVMTTCGPDRTDGTGDDGTWEVAANIGAGSGTSFDPDGTWPSSAAGLGAACHVVSVRLTLADVWPGTQSYPLNMAGIVQAVGRDGSVTNPGDLIETTPTLDVTTPAGSTSATSPQDAQIDMPQSTLSPRAGDAGTLAPGVTEGDMAFSFGNSGARLQDPVVTLLVPEHVSILSWTSSGSGWTPPTPTLTQIPGWAGSTSTLYRFTFPAGTAMPRNTGFRIDYRAALDEFAYGNLRIAGRADSAVTSVLCDYDFFGAGIDTDDMDGDGNTTENRCRWDGSIAPNPAASAALVTQIKGSWDPSFVSGPATGNSTPGSADTYRVTVKNNGRIELTDVNLVDKLPRPGDTDILTTAQRNPATATFPVVLRGAPSVPTLTTAPTVYWSTALDACQPELGYNPSGCTAPAWTDWSATPPSDLSAVTMIRVDFGSNVLKPGFSYSIDLPVTTPTTGATEAEFAEVNPDPLNQPSEQATNSAAFRARRADNSSLLNAAEPPGVTLEMPGAAGPIGPAPTPSPITTSGIGTAEHTATVTPPSGGSVHLLDGTTPVTTLSVPGVGTYRVMPGTGALSFEPELGFDGTAPTVAYRVTDVFGQTGDNTWIATVTTPPGPLAAPLSSTALIGVTQTVAVTVPTGGSLRLLDGSTPVTTLSVPSVGTYRVVGTDLTFEPAFGYHGTPPTVDYRVADAYGQSSDSTYAVSVTLVPLSASTLSSTGVGTAPQHADATVPTGGSVTLLDGSTAVTSLVVPGEGTHVLDPTTGRITFTPELGFLGAATPVAYRVTDVHGQTASSTYVPTVLPPAPPTAPSLSSTSTPDAPSAPQTVTVPTIPTGGTVRLVDGAGQPATTVVVPGQGTFVLDPLTGAITFTPLPDFRGPVTPVPIRITDAYGQDATGSYTPAIARRPVATAAPRGSTGTGRSVPSITVPVPAGGSVRLLDLSGNPVEEVTIAGQGTYRIDTATGAITFTPVAGFVGTPSPVSYVVSDAVGDQTVGTFQPTVVADETAEAGAQGGPSPASLALTGTGIALLLALGSTSLLLGLVLVLTRPRRTVAVVRES